MKKVGFLVKPFASVVFGALMLLYFMNYLTLDGAGLAIGIIAVIMAVYYLAIGIISVILGDKLAKAGKILDIVSISLFALFMFVFLLLSCVRVGADNIGPTGWVIAILSMTSCWALIAFYIVGAFVKMPVFKRFAQLFGAIFALALLLNILFAISGRPFVLGEIDIIKFVMYALFVFMLFSSLKEEASEAQ